MLRQLLKSKIHRATVTDADLNYQGSLTLGYTLMEAAHLVPHEFVHITNINSGVHWVTYTMLDTGNPDTVCMNGTAARHFQRGDPVIILAYGLYNEEEAPRTKARLVYVDAENHIIRVEDA